MRATLLAPALVAALSLLVTACGDSDTSSDAGPVEEGGVGDAEASDAEPDAPGQDAGEGGDGGDGGPVPSDPPELRSVVVSVGGEVPMSFNLSADARWVLPDPAPTVFEVLARDDIDTAEDLVVTVVDVTGTFTGAALGASSSYASGLWEVSVMARPGMELAVRVHDSSGNELISDNHLVLPTQAEALAGDWQQRLYDASQTISARVDLRFTADGAFEESGPGPSEGRTGSYSVDGVGQLRLEQRTEEGGDTDPDTIEAVRIGTFYVDATYFSDRPYTRSDDGDGVEGTWTRSHERGGDLDAVTVTETLSLDADGSFARLTVESESLTGTELSSREETGTYAVEAASSYTESFGNFLVFTVTAVDGEAVTPTSTTELYNVRAGRLLVSPYVASE